MSDHNTSYSPAGAILAAVQYAPNGLATYNVSTTGTPAALDTTNLTVAFEVPSSGSVLLDWYAFAQSDSSGVMGLALLNHSGGAQIGFTLSNFESAVALGTGVIALLGRWLLTGLSSGLLQLDMAAGVTAGTHKIYAQGNTGATNPGKVGPNVITVQAV